MIYNFVFQKKVNIWNILCRKRLGLWWCEPEDHPFCRSIRSVKCPFLYSSIYSNHPDAKSSVSPNQQRRPLPNLLSDSSSPGLQFPRIGRVLCFTENPLSNTFFCISHNLHLVLMPIRKIMRTFIHFFYSFCCAFWGYIL